MRKTHFSHPPIAESHFSQKLFQYKFLKAPMSFPILGKPLSSFKTHYKPEENKLFDPFNVTKNTKSLSKTNQSSWNIPKGKHTHAHNPPQPPSSDVSSSYVTSSSLVREGEDGCYVDGGGFDGDIPSIPFFQSVVKGLMKDPMKIILVSEL